MTATPSPAGDTDVAALWSDDGWNEQAVGQAHYAAHQAGNNGVEGWPKLWYQPWDELDAEHQALHIRAGLHLADAVRQDLIRRLASALNGGAE